MNSVLSASRPNKLIPEILKTHRHGKIVPPHRPHHRLQFVPALSRDPDLLILDLRRYLEFAITNELRDLLCDGGLDALLDLDDLA